MLALTGSEYEFIGSTGEDREGLYLRTEAITNIAWDEPTRRLYEQNQAKGMVFRNLNTLFGRVLAERRTLVSNDVEHDPRAGGRPDGHPELRAFAGLACGEEMVAMIGLANREGGYSAAMIEDLEPATVFVESIVRQARSAAERRLAEARLHAIARATLDTIITIDQKGIILDVNPAIESAFGYTPSECLGQNVSMLMGTPEREAHDGYLAHYLETGEKRIIGLPREVAAYRKDGSQVLVELFVSEVILDGQRCYAGVLRDVTARAQTERRLRDSAAQLSTALEMAKAGHWEYDVAADRFTFNDAFYKIFGATADALGGYHLTPMEYATRFVHPDERAVVGEEVAAALSSNEPHYTRDLQHRFLYFDGRVGQLAVRLTVARDDRGAITKLYGVNQDITERVLQEQTRARVEEQERMNRELAARVEELDRNRNVSALTSECVELLQCCVKLQEGIEVVSRFVDRMYPEANVRVYVQESSLDELQLYRTFERFGGESPRLVIETPDCWALRLRRVYVAQPGGAHLGCDHLSDHPGGVTLCAPLISLDRLVALVSVSMPVSADNLPFEARRAERLAAHFETTIQSLGGALSTISLRESLQRLALVDELTGLPNRRAFARPPRLASHRGSLRRPARPFVRSSPSTVDRVSTRSTARCACLLLVTPWHEDVVASAGKELHPAFDAVGDDLTDATLEAERRVDEPEHLAHLLILEAPLDDLVPRVFELAAEPEPGDPVEHDRGRIPFAPRLARGAVHVE